MPLISTRFPVAFLDEAVNDVVGVRERVQVPGEPLADRLPALEGAVMHSLHGVLGVQIHAGVEITPVVPLDVKLQELPIRTHCFLLLFDSAHPT